jgi:hypothetical protein
MNSRKKYLEVGKGVRQKHVGEDHTEKEVGRWEL